MWVDPFSLRLETPLSTAAGTLTERRGFLVGLEVDGHQGIGEATPLAGWTESYEACQTALNAAVTDSTESDITIPDPTATPAAAHAVELARLDAVAQRDDSRLATVLREEIFDADRPLPEAVPLNATIGGGTIDQTVDAATTAVSEGFEWLKLKVGVQSPQMDLDRIQAVDTAVDESVKLRLDANGAWDRSTATEILDHVADTGVEYLEQPLEATDIDGLADLRGHGVDIAVDESLTEASVEAVIEAEAADVVVLKPMAIGGPRRTLKAAATARDAGIEPAVTTTVDGVVARTAAVHVAAAIPDVTACGLATGSLLESDLAADPVSITAGTAPLPTGSGLCENCFDDLLDRKGSYRRRSE